MAEGRRGGRGETRLSTLEQNLKRTLKGEVLFDRASRGRYATDASIYQIEPVGVVVPRDETDLGLAIDVARELSMSERTLRRRLADEGTSHRRLLAEARREVSIRLLGEQRLSIDEVAQAAGTVGYELMCAVAPRVPLTTD